MKNFADFNGRKLFPSKIICVGMNYAEHIKELGSGNPKEIVLFIKPNSAISQTLFLPEERCRYEGEISFIVKGGELAGVGFGLDLTLSEVQKRLKNKSLPWEKSKAFDSSALFSRFVPFNDVESLKLELSINGQPAQNGGVRLMIYKPAEILAEVKQSFTLEDGDIIMTGTPKGVGSYHVGDSFKGEIISNGKVLVTGGWRVERAAS